MKNKENDILLGILSKLNGSDSSGNQKNDTKGRKPEKETNTHNKEHCKKYSALQSVCLVKASLAFRIS